MSEPPSGAEAAASGYGAGSARAGAPGFALFMDRPHLRQQLREDAQVAGFTVLCAEPLEVLIERGVPAGAVVVLIDCPAPDPRSLAALAREDLAARDGGLQLIVATTLAGLEDIFACLDQSQPQLLVDPSASDLAVALGRSRALVAHKRVREIGDEDRRRLLELTELVIRLVERTGGIGAAIGDGAAPERLEEPAIAFRGSSDHSAGLVRQPQSQLPPAAQIRQILRCRERRGRFFDPALFGDPAWDMLLDLAAAHGEGKEVSVTSLCIASGVPPTTALRWIGLLTEAGLLARKQDDSDRRRVFIGLTDKALRALADYFASLGAAPPPGI